MSKKCYDCSHDIHREQKVCGNPSRPHSRRTPIKKKKSRDTDRSTESQPSSLRKRDKSKVSGRAKHRSHPSGRTDVVDIEQIRKSTRIEDLKEDAGRMVCQSGISRLKTQKKKKHGRIDGKKTKKTNKEITKNNKKNISRSSTFPSFTKILFKFCSCLKSFDLSTSGHSRKDIYCCCCYCGETLAVSTTAPSCCCSRCKCCFHTRDYDTKSVQCGWSKQNETTCSPEGGSIYLSHYVNEDPSDLTSKRFEQSQRSIVDDKSISTHEKRVNHFRSISYKGQMENTPEIQLKNRNIKLNSGITDVQRKNFISMESLVKGDGCSKSIDEKSDSKKCIVAKSLDRLPCKNVETISPPLKKNLEFHGIQRNFRQCQEDDGGKTTKALLIMFDVIFWPYTCLPRYRYRGNENKRKMRNSYSQSFILFLASMMPSKFIIIFYM